MTLLILKIEYNIQRLVSYKKFKLLHIGNRFFFCMCLSKPIRKIKIKLDRLKRNKYLQKLRKINEKNRVFKSDVT